MNFQIFKTLFVVVLMGSLTTTHAKEVWEPFEWQEVGSFAFSEPGLMISTLRIAEPVNYTHSLRFSVPLDCPVKVTRMDLFEEGNEKIDYELTDTSSDVEYKYYIFNLNGGSGASLKSIRIAGQVFTWTDCEINVHTTTSYL